MSLQTTPVFERREMRSFTPNPERRQQMMALRQKHYSQKNIQLLLKRDPPKNLKNQYIYFSLHETAFGRLEEEIKDAENLGQIELFLRVPPGKYGYRNTGRDEIWSLLNPKCFWLHTLEIKMERGGVDKFNTRFQKIFQDFNGTNIPNLQNLTIKFLENMELGHDNFDFLIQSIDTFSNLETCHLLIKFYEYGKRNNDRLKPASYDLFHTSSKKLRVLQLYYKGMNCGETKCYVQFMKHLVAQVKDSLEVLHLELKPEFNHSVGEESLTDFYNLVSRLKNLTSFRCRFPSSSNRLSIYSSNFQKNMLTAFNIPSLAELHLDLTESRVEAKSLCLLFTDIFLYMKALQNLNVCLKGCEVNDRIFKSFRDFGADKAATLRCFTLDLSKTENTDEKVFLYIAQGLAKIKTLREANIVLERKSSAKNYESAREKTKMTPLMHERISKAFEKYFVAPILEKIENYKELIYNFQITWGHEWFTLLRVDYYTNESRTEKDYLQFSLVCSFPPLIHMVCVQSAILQHCFHLERFTYEPGHPVKEENSMNRLYYWGDFLTTLVNQNEDVIWTKLRFYGENSHIISLLVFLRTRPKLVRVMLSAEVSDLENVAEKAEMELPVSKTEFRISANSWYPEKVVELSKKKLLWINLFYCMQKERLTKRLKVRKSIITDLVTEYFEFKEKN